MDISKIGVRQSIIAEIRGEENKERKAESLKRFEVAKDRQAQYIIEKLEQEFSRQSVRDMRTITSINLTKRIVNELASVYKTQPEREFGPDLSDNELEQIENLYKHSKANVKLKKSNQCLKLHNQCAIQVIPRNGIVDIKVLMPHQYDVIPSDSDPEKAEVYILNVFNKDEYITQYGTGDDLANPTRLGGHIGVTRDGVNQKIADNEDYKAQLDRYIWWTKDFNFMTDGKGNMVDEPVANPLGELPFIDIAQEKDGEFWVRSGSGIVEFSLDFGVLLSDTANVNRSQSYSQAVVYAEEIPKDMIVGPNRILYLPLDNNSNKDPRFEFVTPSPDMNASLELLETYLRLFLSSEGMDPKTISGKSEGSNFSSGIERLLSMVDKFEASRNDFDLYHWIESEMYNLMIKWSNIMQDVNDEAKLIDELRISRVDEDSDVMVEFINPEAIQTSAEREESIKRQLDMGLMSKKEAIMELRNVSDEMADEILAEIDADKQININFNPQLEGMDVDQDQEDGSQPDN